MYKGFMKRFLDIFLSLLALIVLSPIFLFVSLFVLIFMGSPIFFKQKRAGKNNKPFYILKFRTMTNKKDANGELLSDEQRRSRFGNFLRSTSLDELPELINILKGDMSFIGPRPLYDYYFPYYTEREAKRMNVRGGLVPPDVLTGNITSSWDEQLEAEADYAENLNFLTDVKVIFATFVILYKRVRFKYGDYARLPLSEERKSKIKSEQTV